MAQVREGSASLPQLLRSICWVQGVWFSQEFGGRCIRSSMAAWECPLLKPRSSLSAWVPRWGDSWDESSWRVREGSIDRGEGMCLALCPHEEVTGLPTMDFEVDWLLFGGLRLTSLSDVLLDFQGPSLLWFPWCCETSIFCSFVMKNRHSTLSFSQVLWAEGRQ